VPQIVAFPEAAVPAGLRAQVLALQVQAFGGPPPQGLGPVHDPALHPVSMLLVDDRVVLSALDVLGKRMVHAGQAWAVTGLSTVVTAPGRRGQGLGRTLVTAARSAMSLGGADLALFTCDRDLRGFYLSCGFDVLDGAVVVGGTVEDPLRSDTLDKVTLTCVFSDRARAQVAAFAGADLALHPGPIDRLW
jgi:aminoglycoside 2'-N-acetyltransferase I